MRLDTTMTTGTDAVVPTTPSGVVVAIESH